MTMAIEMYGRVPTVYVFFLFCVCICVVAPKKKKNDSTRKQKNSIEYTVEREKKWRSKIMMLLCKRICHSFHENKPFLDPQSDNVLSPLKTLNENFHQTNKKTTYTRRHIKSAE